MNVQPFGHTRGGAPASLFSLRNASGFGADICDFGGTVVRLFAPDRNGRLADVVLGFDSVDRYEADSPYFGGIIGRCGNRIARGEFTLDGTMHRLPCNNTPNGHPCHLHGGFRGFDKVTWRAESVSDTAGDSLRLHYQSADGEEGYPGNLNASVTYTVTPNHALQIEYRATTDRPTPVNLTNHSYFNLGGHDAGSIVDHTLRLNAPAFTPVDAGLIPTGALEPVAGTHFDFVHPQRIGSRIDETSDQLRHAGGYDHNFVLQRSSDRLTCAAVLAESSSGRQLEILTTEPGLQFYSGNFLDGKLRGKSGAIYPHRGGLCLETQHFPDAPNQPQFPSVILRPGETYRSTTVYRFSAG